MEEIHLPLGEPVPFVFDLVGGHTRVVQNRADFHLRVASAQQLEIRARDPAVVERNVQSGGITCAGAAAHEMFFTAHLTPSAWNRAKIAQKGAARKAVGRDSAVR